MIEHKKQIRSQILHFMVDDEFIIENADFIDFGQLINDNGVSDKILKRFHKEMQGSIFTNINLKDFNFSSHIKFLERVKPIVQEKKYKISHYSVDDIGGKYFSSKLFFNYKHFAIIITYYGKYFELSVYDDEYCLIFKTTDISIVDLDDFCEIIDKLNDVMGDVISIVNAYNKFNKLMNWMTLKEQQEDYLTISKKEHEIQQERVQLLKNKLISNGK